MPFLQQPAHDQIDAAGAANERPSVRLRDFHPSDQPAFRQLNLEWIARYFTIEPTDLKVLDHPEAFILRPGGCILLAEVTEQIVGTCALIKMSDGGYELAKMAVAPAAQGHHIGYLLAQAAIQRVRELCGQRVYLESNTALVAALSLYRKLGFQPIAHPLSSPYARVDVQMELLLA